jgi:hypothetical protein
MIRETRMDKDKQPILVSDKFIADQCFQFINLRFYPIASVDNVFLWLLTLALS